MPKLSDEEIRQIIADAKAKAPSADNGHSGKSWRDGLITAQALQSKQFKAVHIILPDLIPEG